MPSPSRTTGLLPMRWALIAVIAASAAMLIGILTFAEVHSWPAALLAALASGGASMHVAHQILASDS